MLLEIRLKSSYSYIGSIFLDFSFIFTLCLLEELNFLSGVISVFAINKAERGLFNTGLLIS